MRPIYSWRNRATALTMWAAVAGAAGLAAAGGTARHAVDPAEAANVFGAATCGNVIKDGDGCGVKITSGTASYFCKGAAYGQRLKVTDSLGTSCYTVNNCVTLYSECGSWHSETTCAPSTTSTQSQ